MLENLMLVYDYIQDFEYRNPKSLYDPDDYAIADAKKDDVLGLKAKLNEVEYLLQALQIDKYSIDEVVGTAESIFNLNCNTVNCTVKVDGKIVVNKVNADISTLSKKLTSINKSVLELKKWERVETVVNSDLKYVYDEILKGLDNLNRKNPNDYDYSRIEILGDSKNSISEFEQEIDRTIEYLTELLESRKDYYLALLLVRLRSQLKRGCTDTNLYITDNAMQVKLVEGDFTEAFAQRLLRSIAQIKEVFNNVVNWKIENYGREDTDPLVEPKDDNPAPTPQKNRPSILAYYAMSSKNGKYCSLEGTSMQYEINRYNQHYITVKIADLTPNDRNRPPYNNFFVFSQTGDRTACISARGTYPRGYNNTGLSTSLASKQIKNNYNATAVKSDYIGLQFSTGKNAFVWYAGGKIKTHDSFNPYNKPILVENISKGKYKVTFTGCNFPGICLVQPHADGSSNSPKVTIAVVEKLELVDGNAIAYLAFYERSGRTGEGIILYNSSINGFYTAYLGSYHAITDADPGIKATLFSNIWEETFINTNCESDEIVVTPSTADTPAKIEFKGHQSGKQGYTFINIHYNPEFPDVVPHLDLHQVNSHSIEYDVFDARSQEVIKEQFPVSVLSFQV